MGLGGEGATLAERKAKKREKEEEGAEECDEKKNAYFGLRVIWLNVSEISCRKVLHIKTETD